MAGIFQNGIWVDGFDHYVVAGLKWNVGGAGFGNSDNTVGNQGNGVGGSNLHSRFGVGRSMSVGRSFELGGTCTNLLNTNLTSMIVGAGVYVASGSLPGQNSINPNAVDAFFTFYDQAMSGYQISLGVDSNLRLQFAIGNPDASTTFPNKVGPNSGLFQMFFGQWYYIECKVVIGTGSSGLAEVRVNGNPAPVISYIGTTQSTATTFIGRFSLYSANLSNFFDDFYMLDLSGAAPLNTYLGDVRVWTTYPAADSATAGLNAFSTSPGQTAGNHYQNVHENPPDGDTTFNFDGAVGDRESYGIAPVTVGGPILAVNALADVRKDDSSTRSIAVTTRSNNVDNIGANYFTGSSYVFANQVTTVDPNTSAQWTQAGVNAAEFGIKITT